MTVTAESIVRLSFGPLGKCIGEMTVCISVSRYPTGTAQKPDGPSLLRAKYKNLTTKEVCGGGDIGEVFGGSPCPLCLGVPSVQCCPLSHLSL